MKKLVFLILVTIFMCSCLGHRKITSANNPPPDICQFCDTNNLEEITNEEAAVLIKNFRNSFYASAYGGTIYGSESDFQTISSVTNDKEKFEYQVLKYHFGSDIKDKLDLTLAYENDKCKDNDIADTSVRGHCLKSADVQFKALPKITFGIGMLRKFHNRLRDHKIKPSIRISNPVDKLKQKVDSATVESNIINLKTNENFEKYIGCKLYQGSFNFNSINKIFNDPSNGKRKCEGIRYYFGYTEYSDDKNQVEVYNKIRVILVGVDKDGENLKIWRENSLPNAIKNYKSDSH